MKNAKNKIPHSYCGQHPPATCTTTFPVGHTGISLFGQTMESQMVPEEVHVHCSHKSSSFQDWPILQNSDVNY